MLPMQKLLIALGILMGAINVTTSDELLELACVNDQHCEQFQQANISVSCIKGHCRCIDANGVQSNCKPKDSKLNNIIAGPCPCTQPHAECNIEQHICYCTKEHMPSQDRRRCIQTALHLTESCETDAQCQATDNFAICPKDLRSCRCMSGYIDHDGKCAAVLGSDPNVTATTFNCENATDCVIFGTAATCATKQHKCVCKAGFVSSTNQTVCIRIADYQQSCSEHAQCQQNLGKGAVCQTGFCQCADKYYRREVESAHGGSMRSKCAHVVAYGDYCRTDMDCYQQQWPEISQTLVCSYGECNCKFGYYSINNADCIQSNEGVQFQNQGKSFLALMLIIFNCFYF